MTTSSEYFTYTRSSIRKIRKLWAQASFDERFDIVCYFLGCALMGVAVVGAFGLWGVLFLLGLVIYKGALNEQG